MFASERAEIHIACTSGVGTIGGLEVVEGAMILRIIRPVTA